MQVRFLGRGEPLEEGMPTHSSVPAWKIPWKEDPGGLQPTGSHRVRNAMSETCSISPSEPMSAPDSVPVLPPFEQVHEIWASRATKPLFKISDCCHIGYHPPYSKTPWTVRGCCQGWLPFCCVFKWPFFWTCPKEKNLESSSSYNHTTNHYNKQTTQTHIHIFI
ncbi:hypothetical protein R6Z07M_001299 [Ovis aries]